MARTKQTAKRYGKRLITWTRFHLPREQEWPTWSVDHPDIHVGPLAGAKGLWKASLGRMVDNPEQAAYIIEWFSLDDLKDFQSSPACAEFLRNLPKDNNDNPQISINSDSTLQHADASSRFLILKHATERVTPKVEGRVTFTTFLVPRNVDDVYGMYNNTFDRVFRTFNPRDSEFRFSAVWFWVLAEDEWVEEKFGKLESTQEEDDNTNNNNNQGRTLFCNFFLWQRRLRVDPEHEEPSAADPEAREAWNQAVAQAMPPATAWKQERWDIRELPRFYPLEPEFDPELSPEELEYERERKRLLREYLQLHGFEVGGRSE
ncbi:uncharacterized protein BJX67DRAFT_340528 [Aspergillus lucknowensis]|uniref:Uncharacterized protein n=1 Tax=Aspergillus lucknowensis TaxID=176173 RepID=A0ABR4M8A5_9EURO